MSAPIAYMKKDQILALAGTKCKAHRHTYLEHYKCYLEEVGVPSERVGFLDIESSNLDADFGIILSWCILDGATGIIESDVITKKDIDSVEAGSEDTRIVQSLVTAMLGYSLLVTFYGARFDIPFIRTRATVDEIEFPPYGVLKHRDLWFVCRGKFKLSSNRLENCNRVLNGKTDKTRVDSKYWRGGVRGDEASLAYILDHNQKDVVDLKKLYDKVIHFARPVNSQL